MQELFWVTQDGEIDLEHLEPVLLDRLGKQFLDGAVRGDQVTVAEDHGLQRLDVVQHLRVDRIQLFEVVQKL